MNPVVSFLTENPIVFLATCDYNHHPRVRPFQFLFAIENKLFFCTSGQKKVTEELKYNPSVEIAAISPEQWVRINGRAIFLEDINLKQKVLDENPDIQKIYQNADNPDLLLFYLSNATAALSSIANDAVQFYAMG